MMSCGSCLKWQHIACHDLENKRAGLPNRDWDSVDFICRSCRTKANVGYRPIESESNVPYESTESTRSIFHTNPSITHRQPALIPGPVYKLPTTAHDFMRDASLASPASTHSSNVIGTQNMGVPPQDPTTAVRHRNIFSHADLILPSTEFCIRPTKVEYFLAQSNIISCNTGKLARLGTPRT